MSTSMQAVGRSVPAGPYVPGIIAEGRFVYVSGQLPVTEGRLVPGTIEEETTLALGNVAAILRDAGASLADVVRCGVFLANLADVDGMNAAFEDAFGDHRPTRTTVGVRLTQGKVEIDCVAVLLG